MACEALKFYSNRKIKNFFISNIDPSNLTEVLKQIKAEESIFIISSKSFGTIETLKNASVCKNWFLNISKEKNYIKNHFYGVTANEKAAISFGKDVGKLSVSLNGCISLSIFSVFIVLSDTDATNSLN